MDRRHSFDTEIVRGTPGPLRGMKLWTTEAGFRVPGIVRWPGLFPKGTTPSVAMSALDLLPPFCKLAGVTPPANGKLDGIDCLPLLKGEVTTRDKPLLWCFYKALNERCVAMRTRKWKVLARLADENGKALPRMRNIYPGNYEQYAGAQLIDHQIFQIEDDLGEAVDLSEKNPQGLERLKQQLHEGYAELLSNSYVWEVAE